MNNIIFINSDLEKCQFINSEYNITDNLDSLIEQSDNQSNLIFVLSKQCCFSDYLEVPKKNKSLFKKNAKKIIKQDLEQSSDDLIIINSVLLSPQSRDPQFETTSTSALRQDRDNTEIMERIRKKRQFLFQT